MPTKLSRFCAGVMETAWLAAVCVIPIFFNIYSSRIFEPDKITILRSLALITLAAWIVKLVAEGEIDWKQHSTNKSFLGFILSYPMISPVLALTIVYIVSTIFSVTPSISLAGSYQRLQGTYTTFSYLIIFASILLQLRSKNQINRLITTIIFASLPVSLYGLLQHYQIDPIPWGGNVSIRIASNMGNSIFVAAYLIMVVPLTIGRTIGTFKDILFEERLSPNNPTFKLIIKATIYVFISLLELIAIYLSGSRGPLLGLLAGIYLLILMLSIFWRKRWLTIGIVSLAILGVGFLAVFNINNGPFEPLKKSPYIGRFGLLLDPESNSALVRQYIWEGTVKLVGIHDPIKFPDGSLDRFNLIRPLIGYGPESMYVAYNQFYQPQLGQVEKRNASPDRAHNETWDSIVITGLAGLLVYISIFGTVFYYGLKWLGFITTRRDKVLFFLCLVGGGIGGAIVLIIIRGVEFLGIGLPLGMLLGMIIYLTLYAFLSPMSNKESQAQNPFSILMITIFAAIVGHFVEINFGIAIAATRTLFWIYTGVLIVVGFILHSQYISVEKTANSYETIEFSKNIINATSLKKTSFKQRQRVRKKRLTLVGAKPEWIRLSIIQGLIIGVILVTLGYDYVTNAGHAISIPEIIQNSLIRLPNHDNNISFGIFALIITTWIVGVLLFSSEHENDIENDIWIKSATLSATISILIFILYVILQASSLSILASFSPKDQNDVIRQVNSIGSLLTKYYIFLLILMIISSFLLLEGWSRNRKSYEIINWIFAPVVFIIFFALVNSTNLKVIHADITFKMVEPFTKSNQWQVATFLYKRALELAPKEDHYYLFLGRSYLEQAKVTDQSSDQNILVQQAENDLKKAQMINPLNTDHTANLARLYSWWAGKATDIETRTARAQKASGYYSTAITLSPNNSTLWDEWAVLYMQLFGQLNDAFQKLQHAFELDNRYSFTNGLLGDYYMKVADSADNRNSKLQAMNIAAVYYRTAAEVTKKGDTTPKVTYLVSLGNVYLNQVSIEGNNITEAQLNQWIDELLIMSKSGVINSDQWKIQVTVARIYLQLGDKELANYYANQALGNAPKTATDQINRLISQIRALP